MDMKNSLTTNQLSTTYPPNSGFNNNDEITKLNNSPCNTNENYLNNDTFKQNSDSNYLVSNTTTINQDSDFNTQNDVNRNPNASVMLSQSPTSSYYPYKQSIVQSNDPNTPLNPYNPQPLDYSSSSNMVLTGHNMMSNNYSTPSNICPTTGYEALHIPTNPSLACGCAYCLNYYQNQWYINYYAPPPQYMFPPQTSQSPLQQQNDSHKYTPSNLSPKSLQQTTPPPQYLYMKSPPSNTNNHPDIIYNLAPQQNDMLQNSHEVDQKLAHLTPIYINQPVPSNTEHFQRRTPFKKRDHNALSWLLLYLELEKDVESPTLNARIAWINDMHHIIYTKLTSGIISRWQYEYEFTQLKSLITQKSLEADETFKLYPRLCHCGERFKSDQELTEHSNHCLELKPPFHRCLCGQLFEKHNEFFQHIFSGILQCPMAVYHLWIFFEKYRRRRYKCFCSAVFYNFWVYYVHMGECNEYQNYFQRNCYFCNDYNKKLPANNSSTTTNNNLLLSNLNYSTDSSNPTINSPQNMCWNLSMMGPLKDLVRYSKLQ